MPGAKRRFTPPATITPLSIVDHDRQLTALDRVVELLRVGVDLDHVGGSIGVRPAELRGWLRNANSLYEDLRHGRRWPTYSLEQQALVHFAINAAGAISDWVARQEAMLEQLGRGGYEQVEVRTVETDGRIKSRTETRSRLAPDPRVLTWRLERRLPALYGRRTEVHLTGEDTSADDDVRARLMARLTEVAERLALPEQT